MKMICTDCNQNLPDSEFTTGKHRCHKCQYQYQKSHQLQIKNVLNPLRQSVKNKSPQEKTQLLIDWYPSKFSIHDLAYIFETTDKIVIDTLKTLNKYIKYCYVCNAWKPFNEFAQLKNGSQKDGLQSMCKECKRLYQQNNAEHIAEYQKEYAIKNQQQLFDYRKKYYSNPDNKIKHVNYNKDWYHNQYHTNILFRLNQAFGHAIYTSLKGLKNNIPWQNFVSYSLQELKEHLESKFQPGMTWDNYGEWHIDHIVPKSSFHFESYDDPEFKKCWSLENLQPLWAKDNIRKSNKIGPEWGNDK